MKIFTLILFFIYYSFTFGQKIPELSDFNKMLDTTYTNGFNGYSKDFKHKIIYPKNVKSEGINGRVYFKAVIDTNGNVSEFKIIRSIDPRLNKIVEETFMNTSGKWIVKKNMDGKRRPIEFTDYIFFEIR